MRFCLQNRLQFVFICTGVCCLLILVLNMYELHRMQNEHFSYHHESEHLQSISADTEKHLVYIAFGKDPDSGYLKHVFETFHHFGYIRGSLSSDDDWDVLWAHDYPFKKLYKQLKNLKNHQKVNHFPGTGYITNKMDLAVSNIRFIPKAFKIPAQNTEFIAYAFKHKDKLFVQKSNDHRRIKIQAINDYMLHSNNTFIQEYIDNPFLVDGYKFDIGVYTIITSVDPLRVYIYNGDILFRYCTEKYYPFDPENVNKYVIGDDYLPTWEVPSLRKLYTQLGYSMRDSFDAYAQMQGKDPSKVWRQIDEAISSICLAKEAQIIKLISSQFLSKRNFFEMIRFDFVIDNDFNVFIMEANMSPNLSSAHFPPNRLLYQQVLFSLFNLVGLARGFRRRTYNEFEVSNKNVLVFADVCNKSLCSSCIPYECQLCFSCLTQDDLNTLKEAYMEHTNRQACKRIFPPSMVQEHINTTTVLEDLSPENQMMFHWFKGKCLNDKSWC